MTDIARLGIQVDSTGAVKARGDLDKLGDQAVVTGRQVQSVTRATGGFSTMSNKAKNDAKIFAYQLNQVGQQGAVTGDYMGALSIQAADMLTVFGLWGVLAGGVVAVMGPLALSLFDVGASAEDAQESTDNFIDAVSAIERYTGTAGASISDLRREFGDYARQVREASRLTAQASVSLAFEEFDDAAEGLQSGLDGVAGAISDVARANEQLANVKGLAAEGILGERQVTEAREALELLEDRAIGMLSAMDMSAREATALNEALDLLASADSLQGVADAAANALDLLRGMYGETERIPPEVARIIQNLEGMLRAASSGAAAMSDVEDATSGAASEAGRLASSILTAANNALALRQALASLSMPFGDAMADLDFELATAGMNAADKLVATRMRGLESQMRAQSERVFGFDYGLTEDQRTQLSKYETSLRNAAPTLTAKPGRAGGGGGGGAGGDAEKLHNDMLREAERITLSLEDATARYNRELADLTELYDLGYLSAGEFNAAQKLLHDEMNAEKFDAIRSGVEGFTDALFEGGDALKDWARNAVAELAKVILQMTILKALGMPTDGVMAGGGLLGSLFAGFFDGGGTIPSGQFGVAGENGPELIKGPAHVTSTADTANALGGQQDVNVRVAVDNNGNLQAYVERVAQRRESAIRSEIPGIAVASIREHSKETPL